MRRSSKPAKAKAEARFPLAPKSRKNGAPTVRDLEKRLADALKREAETQEQQTAAAEALQTRNRELAEAHEQQTATSEILRVIASSPTDLGPVMEAVVESAARVCGATNSSIFRLEGENLRLVARHGSLRRTAMTIGDTIPVSPGSLGGRVVGDRRTIHVVDIMAAEAEFPETVSRLRQGGSPVRTTLATPLLREGTPLGVIFVNRGPEVHPFSAKQIALLETFANQAVIAIENVRLFNETKEALEQQTATAEILRVISSSPTDVEPVFETIASSAARLFSEFFVGVVRFDGDLLHLAAQRNFSEEGREAAARAFPCHATRQIPVGWAILERRALNVPDIVERADFQPLLQRALGYRSYMAVPMLREDQPIGGIAVTRGEVKPFSEREVALLQTFADQAVIAIENVRLFTELQERNRAVTEAHAQVSESLEQQTATSEVLKVISRSTFDLQPVLDTLIENATRLCAAESGFLYRFEDNSLRAAADFGVSAELEEYWRGKEVPLGPESVYGRTTLERRTVHVVDALAEPGYGMLEVQRIAGCRTLLGVPMLREAVILGAIVMWRTRVEPFTDKQIGLVETFADQAVIAIENVRLLQELQARTRELARSVEELKALGEVSRAVSATLDVETVLTTIVNRAVELSATDGGAIYEFDEIAHEFELRATHGMTPDLIEAVRDARVRVEEASAVGRACTSRQPVPVRDIRDEPPYPVRDVMLRAGFLSLLVVPLVRQDRVVGLLVVRRRAPGEFPEATANLLQTFAAQSVLAIQNARLFREIADKSRQLEAASRHKSEFLANMSHELRTPLNAILGFSEVLAERMFGEVNEKQAEYLQDILSSGRHLLSLINDILDLSKVEAGRLELELGRFHLPTALDNALTLVRERATRHGITLTPTVDKRVGDIVADERKVKQILLNLLSNAVKFTPEGGRVSLTATVAEGVITIEVSDTGIGIAPEDQAAIFEEFRQVGREDARKQEGTGLGLTLAKKFVELHDGRIWVRSQVGQGSTFSFTLPVRLDGRSASDQGGCGPPRP
jgi:signal transduction histidine kinase